MKKHRFSLIWAALALLVGAAVAVAPQSALAQQSAPVNLTFDKSLSDPSGVWQGTIGGDLTGTLTTVLLSAQPAGPILLVEFDWMISSGPQSFTARLNGILNTETGSVVMNGVVTEGWLVGAQVHEEGQLVDPDSMRFQGIIRLMPATAN